MPSAGAFRLMRNPWNVYLGDCPVVTEYLDAKPLFSRWFPLHAINQFLRAVGQPAFVNNPILGLLILIAIFLYQWQVGLGCVLGGGIATITELLVGLHPWTMVNNGCAGFNGVLVGTVISILYPAVYGVERSEGMWICIALGALTSVFFCSAFNTLLSKVNVPYMALPFNIIAVCVFLTLQPEEQPVQIQATVFNASDPSCGNGRISWCGVGRGILVSMSQVWAVNAVVPSLLMNLAVLLSSPLLFTLCTLGATLGSLLAITILPEHDYQQIYDGVWGYNSLLAMAAAGCVFFPFSPVALGTGTVNALATIIIQAALRVSMDKVRVPYLTLPMTLSTLVILMATQARPNNCGSPLKRTEVSSYPEKQAIEAWRQAKRSAYEQCSQSDLDPEKQDIKENNVNNISADY